MIETPDRFRPPTIVDEVRVSRLADGRDLLVPFHRLAGAAGGPTLGLVALLHGDEPSGAEIVRRILTGIDAAELRGAIVAVSAAHGPAFEAASRNSPIDALDLNRNFPGDADGWQTEQIAHALSSRLLGEVDMLIDIHSADAYGVVDYVYMVDEARELALALGCRHNFVAAQPHPGGLLGVATARGIPGVILELGGGRVAEEAFVRKGVGAIRNVLEHFSMLPRRPRVPVTPIVFHRLATVRPHSGGMVYPALGFDRLGSRVIQDELLGSIVSPLGFETLEELRSPVESGRVLLLRTGLSRINAGDFAYMISDASSEEPGTGSD